MKIEINEKCKACNGTGIYTGIAENDGYGVVCHNCKGTGEYKFAHVYDEFTAKQIRTDVHTVLEANPGIIVGGANHDFGGIEYQEWLKGTGFTDQDAMRNFVCPRWWFQTVDYDKMPKWDECVMLGLFSMCQHFQNKHKCWERWDKEKEEKQ